MVVCAKHPSWEVKEEDLPGAARQVLTRSRDLSYAAGTKRWRLAVSDQSSAGTLVPVRAATSCRRFWTWPRLKVQFSINKWARLGR